MSMTVDSVSSSGFVPKKQVAVTTPNTSVQKSSTVSVKTPSFESAVKGTGGEYSPQFAPSFQRTAFEDWDPFKQNNPYTQFNLEQTVSGISFGAKFLFDNNIDLHNSFTRNTNKQFQFNLSFFENSERTLTANGFYDKQERSLGVNFSYMFTRQVETENGVELRKFEMNFNFSMTDIKEMSGEARIEKEDVMKFVQRIVEEIFDTAKNKDITIANIYLAKSDVEDMMMMGSSEMGRNILDLLAMAIAVAKLRELLNDNKDAKLIDLVPERLKEMVLELQKKEFSDKNMNISIKDLGVVVEKTENEEGKVDAEAAEEYESASKEE